jgi:signal peptidase I
VIVAAILLVALAGIRLWFIQGLLRRITIDGPSMAPALCGAHYEVTCRECQFHFRCDADHPPSSGMAACPNCGYSDNALDQARWRPPERVIVDGWPFLWRRPKRGDIVAAQTMDTSSTLIVKRVAALPGERLAIRDGDLYANGKLVRKTLAELHTVRLLVHDNDFLLPLSSKLPPRWRGTKDNARWKAVGSEIHIDETEAAAEFDWLEYQHWPGTGDARLRGMLAPVRDNDSYNQGEGPRELNAVSDLLLSCQLVARGKGRLALAALDGGERYEIIIEPEKQVSVRRGSEALLEQPLKSDLSRRIVNLEFGLCDQQVLLAIDGKTIVRLAYERAAGSSQEALHPLAIGAVGLAVEISHLKVWRDVYYLDPAGLARPWEAAETLPAGNVALLGDNPPVSIDSRHWKQAGVPVQNAFGRVDRPFWSK